MKKLLLLVLLLAVVSLFSCFSSGTASNDGGSGSEIVGTVETDTTVARVLGWPVIDGKIFIFSSTYEANTSIPSVDYEPRTLTDSNGVFRIDSVKIGTYIIEANNNEGKAVTNYLTITTNDDTYDAGLFTVKKVSSLACSVNTSLPISEPFTYVVFILGTRIYAKGDNTTLSLVLGDIPYGTYTVRFKFTYQGQDYIVDKPNIAFNPGVIQSLMVDFFD